MLAPFTLGTRVAIRLKSLELTHQCAPLLLASHFIYDTNVNILMGCAKYCIYLATMWMTITSRLK